MKLSTLSFVAILASSGFALASPAAASSAAQVSAGSTTDTLLQKRCLGGDDHCDNDNQCCSVSVPLNVICLNVQILIDVISRAYVAM